MNLLIDIGNSRIKAAVGKNREKKIKILKKFPYSKNEFERIFKSSFKQLKIRPDRIGISALRDVNKKVLEKYFNDGYGLKPVFITPGIKLPFKIEYSKGLGSDRICNAAGALDNYRKKNILIIDFGTATTFTMIENNILTGGLISPGIETSLISLVQRTSLPKIKLNFPKKIINNNTADNIKGGVLFQALYAAEGIITVIRKKHKDLFVAATGGLANLICMNSKSIDAIDPDLVLKGINKIISE